MTNRKPPAVAVLLLTAALTAACGADRRPDPAAAPPGAPDAGPATPVTGPPVVPGGTTAAIPPRPAVPAGPSGTTERRPTGPPPVVLPARPAGTPGARQVVAAFRAAGLAAGNPRDRSADCGPDGLGLGCAEIVATDAVTVYVFPDEPSAGDVAEIWRGQSYRRGAVVLNYLEAKSPATDRARYERVLRTLR
ncbi:hypothetical protein Q3W71_02505 [Micromonospora sp. C28SCA-DRY-2]|uniref:hypothetical protein n=1 Tax=Micromonospora sp. C28SCA-DRY-2 TaxID=3059522 RepID=UPI0026770F5A|nr:hypothetical protein [Micromonospora sp. C28SCA-DRY-2]MDO3700550.1 hypothetical protein [Micromonospora sp. C28SCA-DRY-2]